MKAEHTYYNRKRSWMFFWLAVSLYFMFLLVGIFGVLVLNARYLNNYFKEQLTITVYFEHGTPRERIKTLEKQLKTDTLVKEVRFVSKEKAAERAKEILGEDFIAVLGENPLQDNIEVHLHGRYVEDAIVGRFRDRLLREEGVEDVVYEKTILSMLNRNVKKIGTVLLGVSAVLLFLIYFNVRNTVRLSVYNRRHVIKTMQIVGAPEGFILRPFVLTYALLGLAAGLAAAGTLAFLAWKLQTYFPGLQIILSDTQFYLLLGGLVLTALLLSLSTGFFAARAVLRMKWDDIYAY
ncbi:MAG: hypothetical protein GXO27_00065 [Chlorobi bacterium]|nr:hypothetical protein [Chlorobiota bacterium]